MHHRFRREWRAALEASRRLDPQTVFVLLAAVVLIFIQYSLGSRSFFRTNLADDFPALWRPLLSWVWWFGMQGLLGFVVPVVALTGLFRRRPAEIGLGLGDWRLAGVVALAYLPLALVGTWVLSDSPAFQASYPHLRDAILDWRMFALYEAAFLLYWVGWEYLWRGFVLFGTAPTFGVHAVFVQVIPFALLHLDKPLPEGLLSIVGGVALGALVWRCRSFWIAVPIHALQMLFLDLWCTLRVRTGVSGVGWSAFLDLWHRVTL